MFVLRVGVLIGVVCVVRCGLLDGVTGDKGLVGGLTGGADGIGKKVGLPGLGGRKGIVSGQMNKVNNMIQNKPAGILKDSGNVMAQQQANIQQGMNGDDGIDNIKMAAMDTVAEIGGDIMKVKTKDIINKRKQGRKKTTTTTTPEPEDEKEDEKSEDE